MKFKGARHGTAMPSHRETSSSSIRKVDPLWRTRCWLKECKEKVVEEEVKWWPLVCPLMDGSDAAMYALVWRLLTVWCWTVEISRPLICLPAPTILNIGQFLDEDVQGRGWDVQDWLQAYTCTLQHTTEAAEERCWMPMGRNFTPRVSLLVEAFTSVLKFEILLVSAVSCWDSPPVHIPHQKDKGPLAHDISYLDEKATCQPTLKAWDELDWPPPLTAPPTPKRNQ